MTRRIPLMIVLFTLLALPVLAADVANLQVGQLENRAFAQYDLIGEPGEKQADVTVAIEINKKRYQRLTLTGDVGKGIRVGLGKRVWWDLLQDMPAGWTGEIIWDIEASKMPAEEQPPIQLPGAVAYGAYAASSSGKSYSDPATGMEFILIPGGNFQMGDSFGDGNSDEKPVHPVSLDPFFMARYTVTVDQFGKFVTATGYRTEAEKGDGCYTVDDKGNWGKKKEANWKAPGFAQDMDNPVVCVSWNDASAFIQWLARKSSKAYRLPTEAEWEYAARSGGKQYKYAWGNGAPSGNIADVSLKRKFPNWPWDIWKGYDDGYVFTAPVGRFKPNELGLYDMTGNVWQWCSDRYDSEYYKNSPRKNPQGAASGDTRVLRGGSWDDRPSYLRASSRAGDYPDNRHYYFGFRLVFSPQ